MLEGTSFLRSILQALSEAEALHRELIEHVLATSAGTLLSLSAPDEPTLTAES